MASSSQFSPSIDSSSSNSSSDESSSDGDRNTIAQRYRKRMQNVTNLLASPQMLTLLLQTSNRRRPITRDREGSHKQIWRDYFAADCTYPPQYFRQRYRMRKELFLRILSDVEAFDPYFVRKKDAVGRWGLSSIQKVISAIHILAYGFVADHCDEYIKIGKSTAIESLKLFCDAVIGLYERQYLRAPNEVELAHILQQNEERGFPGMLGSVDCMPMHWQWKNCPTAWHGTHRGHRGKPTLILEAIASEDLWIWHAFFSMAGSHNDLNLLDHSPIFDNFIHGQMPPVNYEVNGHRYTLGYYLSDGIYPKWPTLMQTIPNPTNPKEQKFAEKQEAARKDVERAFGMLQIKWGITQGPVRFWNKEDLCSIMKTCIILHNMIIEDERGKELDKWSPLSEETISHPTYDRDPVVLAACINSRLAKIRNRGTNSMLRLDLIEHVWRHYGDETI